MLVTKMKNELPFIFDKRHKVVLTFINTYYKAKTLFKVCI